MLCCCCCARIYFRRFTIMMSPSDCVITLFFAFLLLVLVVLFVTSLELLGFDINGFDIDKNEKLYKSSIFLSVSQIAQSVLFIHSFKHHSIANWTLNIKAKKQRAFEWFIDIDVGRDKNRISFKKQLSFYGFYLQPSNKKISVTINRSCIVVLHVLRFPFPPVSGEICHF